MNFAAAHSHFAFCLRRPGRIPHPIGLRWNWLDVPNHLRILHNTSITAKGAHPRNGRNAPRHPLLLLLILHVNELLGLAVRRKVIGDEVVVAMVNDAVDERGEGTGLPKSTLFNLIKDLGKGFVEMVIAIDVGVAQIVDVFGEVAEEENVVLADFARDFDL